MDVTGANGLSIYNSGVKTASILQNGNITIGNINNIGTGTFSISSSGAALSLRQSGDQYGASRISMMNRSGQNGFVVATENPTVTLNIFRTIKWSVWLSANYKVRIKSCVLHNRYT